MHCSMHLIMAAPVKGKIVRLLPKPQLLLNLVATLEREGMTAPQETQQWRACLLHGIIYEGRPVAHAHVHLGFQAPPFQALRQRLGLLLGDAPQGGPAPNGLVAL